MDIKYYAGSRGLAVTTTPTYSVVDDGDGWYTITVPDTEAHFLVNVPGYQPVPMTYTPDASIAHDVARLLGTQMAVVASPIAQDGDISLLAGDTYAVADGRAIEWTQMGPGWPDLTGATVVFDFGTTDMPRGAVANPGTDQQSIVLELTSEQTTALPLGARSYQLRAILPSTHVITLASGTLTVSSQI